MGQRVLVVEDEEDIAFPLVRTLEREGYEVSWVDSGQRALDDLAGIPAWRHWAAKGRVPLNRILSLDRKTLCIKYNSGYCYQHSGDDQCPAMCNIQKVDYSKDDVPQLHVYEASSE